MLLKVTLIISINNHTHPFSYAAAGCGLVEGLLSHRSIAFDCVAFLRFSYSIRKIYLKRVTQCLNGGTQSLPIDLNSKKLDLDNKN